MYKKLILVLFLLVSEIAIAQYHEIKSLRRQLPHINDSITKINTLNRLGYLYFFRHVDSCYYYADRAKAMAEKLCYQKGIADAYKVYGIAITGENNYLAAKYYNEALDIYRQIGDKENECTLLINISNLLYVDNDTTKAYNYANEADHISQRIAKDSVKAGVIVNIVYHRNKNEDVTSPLYRLLLRGLAIAEKYHDERAIMGYLQLQGGFIWRSGNHEEAINFVKNNISKADAFGNIFGKINFYCELAGWVSVTDPSASADYYEQALKYASANGYHMLSAWIAGQLYTYFNTTHQTDKALQYASMVIDANQKIQFDLKKSGVDALMYVQKDNELKLSKEKQQTTAKLLGIFLVLLLAIIALLFFIVRSYLISKKYARSEHELRTSTQNRNVELETWNNFNNTLIAVLAHDLRQPFSSIIMTANLMEFTKKELEEAELKEIMADLKDNAHKSIELLEGLLVWVKSKKEGFEYQTQPLLLNDLIAESNGLYMYDQQKKNITLSNEIPPRQIVMAQKQMMLFINRNLISNATKYSKQNSLIRVYCATSDNEIVVTFEDNGSGMTRKQIDNLFMAGDKVTMEGTAVKGAGIALSICHDMILQMNGRLWVESEPNKFTKFHYALPL